MNLVETEKDVQVNSEPIVSKCSCGIKRTLREFRTLHFVGFMHPEDGSEPSQLEQRNCVCNSTIAIWLTSDGEYYDDSEPREGVIQK